LHTAFDNWMLSFSNLGVQPELTKGDFTINDDCGAMLEPTCPGQPLSESALLGANDGTYQIFFDLLNKKGASCSGAVSKYGLGSAVLAFTFLDLSPNDGSLQIVDSDILFNASRTYFTSASPTQPHNGFSFLGILTHELGHFFGIAHSLVTDDNNSDGLYTGSSMFPSIAGKTQSKEIETLSLDDELSILNLYPKNGSFTPNQTAGSISGTVLREDGQGQRGAQITAFSLVENRTLASTFSSVTGTHGDPNGFYEIKGLPLNHEFVVFIEPSNRPEVHGSFSGLTINTPIAHAASSGTTGYPQFALEGYPDAKIVDIRVTKDVSVSPSFHNAESITLNTSNPSRTDIDFVISKVFVAPNDPPPSLNPGDYDLFEMKFMTPNQSEAQDLLISNSNPLQLDIRYGLGLTSQLSGAELTVTAQSGGSTIDWSDLVSSDPIETTWTRYTLKPPSSGNGSYMVTARLSGGKLYTDQVVTQAVTLSDWNSGIASVEYGPEPSFGGASSSSGGCSLRPLERRWHWVSLSFFALILGAFVAGLRRITIEN